MTRMTLILIEKDPLVALDLAQIVTGFLPDVDVLAFTSLAESEAARNKNDPADLLVFRTSSSRDDAMVSLSVARRLARSIIAISDSLRRGELNLDKVVVVPQPFTQSRLVDALVTWSAWR